MTPYINILTYSLCRWKMAEMERQKTFPNHAPVHRINTFLQIPQENLWISSQLLFKKQTVPYKTFCENV